MVNDRRELENRVAIVTGAARGLGEAIGHSLAEAGASVIIADVLRDKSQDVAGAIAQDGGTAVAWELDVTDEAQVRDLFDRAIETYGRVDIVVNNAGIDVTAPIEELTVQDWNRVLNVNLNGPFMMCKMAFPVLKKNGGGSIVNILSTAAKRAWANASVYHASKFGLMGLTYALHVEGRPHKIKVTAIVAGGMRTPFLLDRFPDIDVDTLQDPRNVARAVRFVVDQPVETVVPEMMVIPLRETSWP